MILVLIKLQVLCNDFFFWGSQSPLSSDSVVCYSNWEKRYKPECEHNHKYTKVFFSPHSHYSSVYSQHLLCVLSEILSHVLPCSVPSEYMVKRNGYPAFYYSDVGDCFEQSSCLYHQHKIFARPRTTRGTLMQRTWGRAKDWEHFTSGRWQHLLRLQQFHCHRDR